MRYFAFVRACFTAGILGGLLPAALTLSCDSSESDATSKTEVTSCSHSSQCADDQVCEFPDDSERSLSVVAPLRCYEVQCTQENVESLCGPGYTCVGPAQAMRLDGRLFDAYACRDITAICGTPCASEADCGDGELCRENGACELTMCDEADAPECPPQWSCDPSRSAAEPAAIAGVDYDPNSNVALSRGCVHTRCDQPDGVTCNELWECDPERGTDSGGCVAVPCEVSGRCSSDESMICTPTSEKGRSPNTDPHGCVSRNCEEGRECNYVVQGENVGYCDHEGAYASADGCAALPCSETDGLCYGALLCDPDSLQADERGCRPPSCLEGTTCPGGRECDPSNPNTDNQGCVLPTVQVVEQDGSGGGSGDTGSGGGTGDSDPDTNTGGEPDDGDDDSSRPLEALLDDATNSDGASSQDDDTDDAPDVEDTSNPRDTRGDEDDSSDDEARRGICVAAE